MIDNVIAFALCVIAVCEVLRTVCGLKQLSMLQAESGQRENAYSEFVNSLHYTDKEFVERMLREFEEGENDDGENGK